MAGTPCQDSPAKELSRCHSNTQPGPDLNGLPACLACGFCRPRYASHTHTYYRFCTSVLLSHCFIMESLYDRFQRSPLSKGSDKLQRRLLLTSHGLRVLNKQFACISAHPSCTIPRHHTFQHGLFNSSQQLHGKQYISLYSPSQVPRSLCKVMSCVTHRLSLAPLVCLKCVAHTSVNNSVRLSLPGR